VDWVLVIGFIAAFVLIDKVNGHQRQFSLTDQSLMYTMALKETIPPWLLVVCAVVAPVAIMLLWTLIVPPLGSLQRRRWRKGEITWSEKLWDANLSLLGIGLAVASTITVTNTFKNLVGRPRPGIPAQMPYLNAVDFLDRCRPLISATNPSVFTLSTSLVCSRTDFLKDGYRSFPSGHSSSIIPCHMCSNSSLICGIRISDSLHRGKTKCS
jgi:diacylglycerol diphosphate phosphatase / phosphatidate phosphatase